MLCFLPLSDESYLVLTVELNANVVVQICSSVIQRTCLDDDVARHNIEPSVKARTTVGAKEVSVLASRLSDGIVPLGFT